MLSDWGRSGGGFLRLMLDISDISSIQRVTLKIFTQ